MANECGSPGCLLDGLKEVITAQGKTLEKQHEDSREFIRELMDTKIRNVTDELARTNKALEGYASTLDKHAGDLYAQNRALSERVTKIETEVGPNGLEMRIRGIVTDNDDLKWAGRVRQNISAIAVAVAISMIIAVGGLVWTAQSYMGEIKKLVNQKNQTPAAGIGNTGH